MSEEIDMLKEANDTFMENAESLGKLVEYLDKVIATAVNLSARVDALESRLAYLLSKDEAYMKALDACLAQEQAEKKEEAV